MNGVAAQPTCEVSRSAAAPCSPTCRSRSGSRPVIRSGGSGSWPIRPLIGSIPRFVSSTPQKAVHRCRPSCCCWPRCCRRSMASAAGVLCWSSCTTTCFFAGLSFWVPMNRSGIPQRSPKTVSGCSMRSSWSASSTR